MCFMDIVLCSFCACETYDSNWAPTEDTLLYLVEVNLNNQSIINISNSLTSAHLVRGSTHELK